MKRDSLFRIKKINFEGPKAIAQCVFGFCRVGLPLGFHLASNTFPDLSFSENKKEKN